MKRSEEKKAEAKQRSVCETKPQSYLSNKAVGGGVGGGAAIRALKSTFSPKSFAIGLEKKKKTKSSVRKRRNPTDID